MYIIHTLYRVHLSIGTVGSTDAGWGEQGEEKVGVGEWVRAAPGTGSGYGLSERTAAALKVKGGLCSHVAAQLATEGPHAF